MKTRHLIKYSSYLLKIAITFLAFLLFHSVKAQVVNYELIKKVALNAYILNSGISRDDLKISEVIPVKVNNEVVYYIFNFEKQGHIVISNEYAVEPILGYGLNANIDLSNIPPGLSCLLDNFKDEIIYIKEKKLSINQETIEKWNYLTKLSEHFALKSYVQGNYLLQSQWNQKYGYNQFCPIDPITGSKSVVGCGGVALAQILRYWECKVFPDKSISYTPLGFASPISVNFYDFDYRWGDMSNTFANEHNALLLFHSAVAIRSNFSSKSTSSYVTNIRPALTNYFGFNADNVKYKNFYESTWINMLINEINAGRPIYYVGYKNESGSTTGHAWVIDGYNSTNQFHCNWGWGGEYDSWYTLTSLNPGSHTYNDGQGAVMNIKPILDSCIGINGANEVCTSNTIFSISIPSSASVVWTKSENITQVSGNNIASYVVRASSNLIKDTGFVKATIRNSQGRIF